MNCLDSDNGGWVTGRRGVVPLGANRRSETVGSGTLGEVSSESEDGPTLAARELAFDTLIPRSRNDVLVRQFDDGAVAWSPIASQPWLLEPLTNALFNLLDGQVSTGELIADLCAVLEVSEPVARDVLRHELWQLESAGMLTTSLEAVQPEPEDDVFPALRDP